MSPGFTRTTTRILSVCMVLVGIALVARTLAEGGGAVARGVLVGVLFMAAGAGRLWVQARSERG